MAIPTAAEREARRQALQGKGAPPIPPTAPPQGRRQQVKERAVASDLLDAEITADKGEGELYRQLLAEVQRQNMLLTPEAAREEAQARLAQMRPGPYYVGGFKPVEFKSAAGVLPVARPQEFPVSPEKPVTFLEALAPQTRAGERAVDKVKRQSTASIFDDKAFNESITALPDADKREQLDAYEAYKAAFKTVRDLNPLEKSGVTDEDIKRDLDRQLKALSSGDIKTFVDDPANRMGYGGDPLARALQKQVTKGAPVPILEPGQTEFVSTLDRLKRTRATSAAVSDAEKRLRSGGVPIMKTVRKPTGERGPGGRPVFEETEVPTGQFRPATPEEISRATTSVSAFTDKEMPKPLYAEAGKLDQFFSANDKAAKGGVIFQKEFPSGATVEGPVSWFVRSALAVPNALVGAASEVFTPEEVTGRERAARPGLYKDTSASIYSVASSRGLMGEIGDLYEYAPESWTLGGKPLKEYTTYAKAAGFAGDLIGFDLGLIGGAVTGLRGSAAGARAARAAGEGAGAAAKAAARTGIAAGSKEFFETIGLQGLVASKIPVGDVRLQFGVSLGDSMRAADEYRAALRRGDTPADALRAAETVAPRSKFVADAATSPPQSVTDIDSIFKGASDEWAEVKRVGDSVRALQSATGAGADLAAVRPYIAAAVRNTPELAARIQAQAGAVERLTVRQIIDDVSSLTPDRAKDFYNTITDAVTVEKGFQGIDRAVGAIEPGRFSIRLTPNTFTTSDNIDDILKDVRASDEYKNVQQITRGGVNESSLYAIPDVQLPSGATIKGQLLEHIEREGASGTFPRSQLARVVESVNNGAITGDDLRLLMQSVTDTVAAAGGKRAFPERALAEGKRQAVPRGFPVKDAARPTLRSEGPTAGLFNRGWIAVADKIEGLAKGPSNMSQYLSRSQIRILEEGKRKMSGLKALMAAELKALREQGITDPFDQAAALVGNLNSTDTWRNIARSSIFGRSDTSTLDLILGNVRYKDPFDFLNAAGRDELRLVIDAAAARGAATPNDIDDFINSIRFLADNDKYTLPGFIKGGGVVFDLRDKPIEVLASAWARGKVDQISSDTIARVLDFEPDTIGALTQALRNGLGVRRTADGRLISDLPINTVVGDAMQNGGTMTSDPSKLKGIKLFNDEVDKITDLSAADKALIKGLVSNPAGLMRPEVDATYALLSAKYGNNADIIAAEGAQLFSGKATLGELGGPMGSALGKAVRDDFGKSPDFEGFTKELGVLAELGTRGPTASGALRASRFMTGALDTYNSIFYNLVLSANPRYHGTNFVTGPFIGYTTTGRVAIPDLFSGAKVIGRGENAAARAEVIAIDQTTGVPVTLGELYDKAIKGGVFRSQLQAQLDPRFLNDAKSLGLATMTGGGRATNKVLNGLRYPAEAANASDFVWRMSYVIDGIKQGKGVDEAMDVGRRSLYDYGAATPFERKYVAKNILFYNFFRNSLLETGRQALTSPARLARQARLTQDFSKLQVGDEKWNEMRFYTPYDAGVARIVLGFAPQAGREGSITLFPNMPWYDAAYIMSGILTTPGDLLQGVADPVTGKRDYGSGYIFNKIGPGGQAALSFVTGADMLADVRLKKDEAPIPHVAAMDELGFLPMYTRFFNIKKIPAEGGQTGWNGYVYKMEPEDFERYKTFIKGAKLLGAQRPVDDFSKWFATWDLPGTGADRVTGPPATATLTPAEAAGVLLDTKAGVPAEAELSAPKTRARQFKEDVKAATPTREELKARRPQ